MVEPAKDMMQLIWEIRRLFQRLANESNDLLAQFSITTSQRAVLEFLDRCEPETLANMARANDVSRQHIQQIVNDLMANGLVESRDNPAHKRSFLIQRTRQGMALFAEVKAIEARMSKEIGKNFSHQELQSTMSTLEKFNAYLHSEDWSQIKSRFVN